MAIPNNYVISDDEAYKQALAVIEDRKVRYGSPWPHFVEVAIAWSKIFGVNILPSEVCEAMAELKKIRQANKHDNDNIIDFHGYSILGNLCQKEEKGQGFVSENPLRFVTQSHMVPSEVTVPKDIAGSLGRLFKKLDPQDMEVLTWAMAACASVNRMKGYEDSNAKSVKPAP